MARSDAKPHRLFDSALVRAPPNSYSSCLSTNPVRNTIDVTLAKEQHRTYVSILKEAGIKTSELSPLEQFPDSVFMQDPALLGVDQAVIGRFAATSRRGEEMELEKDLRGGKASVGSLKRITAPSTLEGGDILITDHELFVGDSQRTNSNGITQLAAILSKLKAKEVKTRLFHLLCGVTYLSERTMIISPELVGEDNFPGYRFIEIPKQDAYSCDALYLGEGKVLIPSGFPNTATKLRNFGYVPVEVDMSEFYKGDGGVTCLSSPIYRIL